MITRRMKRLSLAWLFSLVLTAVAQAPTLDSADAPVGERETVRLRCEVRERGVRSRKVRIRGHDLSQEPIVTGSSPARLNDEELRKLLARLEQLVLDGGASLDDYGELAACVRTVLDSRVLRN